MEAPGRIADGRRVQAGPSPGVGPNGRPLCRWCHGEVPAGRRKTWCSDECVRQFREQADPRLLCDRRDHGVCAVCHMDTEKLERILQHADRSFWRHRPRDPKVRVSFARYLRPAIESPSELVLRVLGAPRHRVSLWDADHIVPVRDGGGAEPANLRTLCWWCHRDVTARWRREREARRG